MKLLVTVMVAAITAIVYSLVQDIGVSSLTENQWLFLLTGTASLAGAWALISIFGILSKYQFLLKSGLLFLASFGIFCFSLMFLNVNFNIKDFAILFGSAGLLAVLLSLEKSRNALVLVSVMLIGASVVFVAKTDFSAEESLPQPNGITTGYKYSSLDDISIDSVTVPNTGNQDGGAIAGFYQSVLFLVTGDGKIVQVDPRAPSISVKQVGNLDFGLQSYLDSAPDSNRWYRIADAFIDEKDSVLFVSYTKWHPKEQCYTVNLDYYEIQKDHFAISSEAIPVFESSPCLTMKILNNEAGGRILKLSGSSILFSIGDFHAPDSLNLADYNASDYGKMFQYDMIAKQTSVYTTGHRNAQGLEYCDGNIYSTEHGPYGGDELNLINKGQDYGWPVSSYGTDYGKKILTISGESGQHINGVKPIYAWTPSIGISSLICYSGSLFKNWKGDLLVGSLNGLGSGSSLYRTRLYEGRAISIERIELGSKVRDLIELEDGKILAWNGVSTVSVLSPAKSVFSSCAGCHNMRYRSHGIGPDLWGIVDANIARHGDRYKYSEAMESMSGIWTRQRLHSFLKDPQGYAPGTMMAMDGIKDFQRREEIINYLEGVSKDR